MVMMCVVCEAVTVVGNDVGDLLGQRKRGEHCIALNNIAHISGQGGLGLSSFVASELFINTIIYLLRFRASCHSFGFTFFVTVVAEFPGRISIIAIIILQHTIAREVSTAPLAFATPSREVW